MTSSSGVLLGRVRAAALDGDPERTAEQAMEPGPSTIRADTDLHDLARRMDDDELTLLPVTDPDGHLLGIVSRRDLP